LTQLKELQEQRLPNEVAIDIKQVEQALRKAKRGLPKGRPVDATALADKVQDKFGHLSAVHIVALASEMNLAMTEVYEVATFYHHFDIIKEGDAIPQAITVRVCDSVACEIAGAKELLQKLPGILGKDVRVIAAPCIGRCESAPAAVVHQNPVCDATVEKITALVKQKSTKHDHASYISYIGFDDYKKQSGYATWLACATGKRDIESVTKEMENSGLRGLGGAGFPAGRKWRIVRDETGPRYMAVNIDEGEPGTFKDRWYLERDPHRFLEGMLIAAWAVGIDSIWVYLRDEYHGVRENLEKEIAALKANPPGGIKLPEMDLRRGAGAYICGEESAMIESIEGKRGMPRLRPPYVAQVGLFNRPTLEHNMETLYWVRDILEKGANWFADKGRNGRKGLRSFSVSGRVKNPGVHLAPAGITIKELIAEYCGGMLDGHQFYGYLPGGASGGILPANLDSIPLDFDTLQPYGCFIGSAAIVIFSQHDKATDVARNLMAFFKHESCGQCTPCRVGTAKALTLMQAPKWDQGLLNELSTAMMDASICGLGQAAPNPIQSVLKYFPIEVQ
jgi:formate dehydrogenase beta subunit